MKKVLVKGALFVMLLFTCTTMIFADTGKKNKKYFSFEDFEVQIKESTEQGSEKNHENNSDYDLSDTDKIITVYNPEYLVTETRTEKINRKIREQFKTTKKQKIVIELCFGIIIIIMAVMLRKMIRK